MEEEDYVDGEGIISDESDFYGSESTRKGLEKQVKRAALTSAQPPSKKPKHSSPPSSTTKPKPQTSNDNVLDFLKSRPQLNRMQQASQTSASSQPNPKPSVPNSDLVPNRRFEGHHDAWQQNETVVDFLRRLPVSDPATASIGPWLWVGNPRYPSHWNRQEDKFDLSSFRSAGETLLSGFDDLRERIKDENPGKVQATITRKMNPHRDVLEKALLATATKHHVTSGKWMLFPNAEELPRSWRIVAEATAAGKLGPTSKVGTWEPGSEKKGTLICVYTYDFNDYEDVKRVLGELLRLELFRLSGRQIYYKCDAYTHLDIGSSNAWNLKASIYASAKVLEDVEGVVKGGGAAKKRNGMMDGFLKKSGKVESSLKHEGWEF